MNELKNIPTTTTGSAHETTLVPVMTPERDEWQLIKEQSKVAIASGLLPKHITKPEQAAIIALKGKELGIPIMQALSSISVINGKPALSAELMLALIYRRVKGSKVIFKTVPEKANTECEVEAHRTGLPGQSFRFTIEDAKRAGLLGNPSWTKYPQAMLRARCVSAMARAVFPDAIQACYTPEEMGVEVEHEEEVVHHQVEARIEPHPETYAVKAHIGPTLDKLTERFKPKGVTNEGSETDR